MKVLGVSSVYSAYKPQKASELKKTGKAEEKKDALSISSAAKDYQTAARAVAGTPDIRQEKIDEIRAKMQSGSYLVSEGDVAEKIFAML